jgi:hypothetical protein
MAALSYFPGAYAGRFALASGGISGSKWAISTSIHGKFRAF